MKPLWQAWIQDIVITNRCRFNCSHCTQALTHLTRDQRYDMSIPYLSKALDSLQGFGGAVNCFGGEPTIHKEFGKVMALWREKLPPHRRASFSCGGPAYRKHKEEIDLTFPTFNYNDHHTPSRHQPVLVAGADIIPDPATRQRLQSRCWMQHMWGASITPAGGYFCEMAGTIDWLFFGGKHAYPLVPGWMRKTPAQFADQSNALCQFCGIPYGMRSYKDTDKLEILSKTTKDMLGDMGSPVVKKGKYTIVQERNYSDYVRPAGLPADKYTPPDGVHHWYRVHPRTRLRQKLMTVPYHFKRLLWWPLVDALRGNK